MGQLGKVQIGQKAPDFHCDAVIEGVIEEVSLATYISPAHRAWLILLFIPAAFSFVCPTEVLAFQNCLEEFKDRNCEVVFVSVDTKHSLWHWQNVPRQYGGLGQVGIPLLSDANHRMSRDYGVLVEEEGVCLRGMFILDEDTVVQQVTLNNLTVGRSVLEALRLLEAFQAVAKHGVLCPIDWKPSGNTADTISTISNTLTESYEDRLENLKREFGNGVVVTDLDAKHKREDEVKSTIERDEIVPSSGAIDGKSLLRRKSQSESIAPSVRSVDGHLTTVSIYGDGNVEGYNTPSPPPTKKVNDCLPRGLVVSTKSSHAGLREHSLSAPSSSNATPLPTPNTADIPTQQSRINSMATTARHARGHHSTAPSAPSAPLNRPSTTNTIATNNSVQPNSPITTNQNHTHLRHLTQQRNTYETCRGSHVVLEFADPTSSPSTLNINGQQIAIPATAATKIGGHPNPPSSTSPLPSIPPASLAQYHSTSSTHSLGSRSATSSPALSRQTTSVHPRSPLQDQGGQGSSQTRLQATFEAIKKMSAGLSSPRIDFGTRRSAHASGSGSGSAVGSGVTVEVEGPKTPGYFDVVVDGE
ncbi:unnamed protein product [Periconia digitata]|uniref:Thioredoxin domain-containing protein n=1 Tax=Periconia digitata TaxID=1303443 RepID=A0A9W4UIM3_9PLEO|nr:unnamed protein product [Periconia digitata]